MNASQLIYRSRQMQQTTRGCNVARGTSLRLSSFRETTLYRRCPRNDVGSPRHYGAALFRATSLQGGVARRAGAPECKRARAHATLTECRLISSP